MNKEIFMSTSQDERIAMHSRMTHQDFDRALVRRWKGDGDVKTKIFLGLPLILLNHGYWAFYAFAYFIAPMELPPVTNGAGDVNFSAFANHALVWYLQIAYAMGLLAYVFEVFLLVPWGIKAPLVAPPNVDLFKYSGIHLVIIATLSMLKGHGLSAYGILIVCEGLTLMYIFWFQPAFGFVPWTDADYKKSLTVPATASAAVVRNEGDSHKSATEEAVYTVPFEARLSEKNFQSIHGMALIKEKLSEPARLILAPRTARHENPRNGILMHGEPGNGKTVFAEALAGEFNVPIIQVTYGEMSSQWVGNMPKVLSNTFAYAKRCAPCVLFIDEIDSFIKSRGSAGGSAEDLKITNTLLTEIVNLRGHQVILIAATNYMANLDAAAIREGRFDFKVEITPPDEEARIGLIHAGIKAYAQTLTVVPEDAISVAKRWNGFSVARLMAIARALPDVAKKNASNTIGLAQWMQALREVQGRRGKLPSHAKSLADLILDAQTRVTLETIASRLKDVARIESLGGTLPSGILFHGPSGTGKTAAARAVAKEVGWAFFSVAGPDLVAERGKLDELFAEAKDIRPAIIFVDEADDILRDRAYTSSPEFVNKLLTIMDGAEDKVKDVVWIAATNYPEQVDPALMRSGRFTEKVQFATPPQDQIPRHIENWLWHRNTGLTAEIDAFDVAQLLSGKTIADVDGVLQYALNCAIGRTVRDAKPTIEKDDLDQALHVVLGATDFVSRAKDSIERTIANDDGIPAETVIAKLESKLAAARKAHLS
jgi:transitional endoplasmic reticulum ATPase